MIKIEDDVVVSNGFLQQEGSGFESKLLIIFKKKASFIPKIHFIYPSIKGFPVAVSVVKNLKAALTEDCCCKTVS